MQHLFLFSELSMAEGGLIKMKQTTKKLMSMVLAFVMVFSMTAVTPAEMAKTKAATVTFTAERFTIGQGYLVKPTTVEIKEGDTVATIFEKVMRLNNITYPSTESDYGFYLSAINNADTGVVNIPSEISSMADIPMWDGSVANAPSNDNNIGNALADKALGTGSYHTMGGWLFMVNNTDPGTTATDIKVKDGDVIRLQFSLYGYGADIGFDTEEFTGIVSPKLADKDVLTRESATVTEEMLKNDMIKAAYENAMTVLQTYAVSQQITDAAVKVLHQAKKEYEDSLKVKESNPVVPNVKRAVISKISNVKKFKAKIRVKKMSGVSGYQFKYAVNRKLKKATVKTTTKGVITTKKLKKKQKCYAKVRAYVNVNGTKVFGSWSKVKFVKIKK